MIAGCPYSMPATGVQPLPWESGTRACSLEEPPPEPGRVKEARGGGIGEGNDAFKNEMS